MHDSTFAYLQPPQAQIDRMQECRVSFAELANFLDEIVPDGPDKTYLMRKLREVGMWANIAITRNPDGSPRTE